MDLRKGRFVVAGQVRVSGRTRFDAVALSEDLANDRAYAIAVGPAGPQRSAFVHSDLTGNPSSADPPADAFTFADLTGVPASFLAKSATIGAGSYLRFSGCRAQVLGGFKATIPLPACYVNFGSDPNSRKTRSVAPTLVRATSSPGMPTRSAR
jgi:hypothetical protein